MTFKPAKCPNCAGDLQVPEDRDTVKCMYCGSDIVVREAIKLAGGVNIDNLLELAEHAEKTKKYEEAYKYYSTVLEHESKNVIAWVGKGITSGYPAVSKEDINRAVAVSGDKKKVKEQLERRLTEFGRSNDSYLFRAISLLDQDDPIGLIGKAESVREDIKSLDYYQEALDRSNNDSTIKKLIFADDRKNDRMEYILRLAYIDLKENLDSYLMRTKPVYDFIERNAPSVWKNGVFEQAIIGRHINRLNDSHSRPGELGNGHDAKIINYLEKEVRKKSPEKNYDRPSTESEKDKRCYIATAAYDSPMASEVEILRTFRDEHLKATEWGKAFIKYYYIIGPHIARLIDKSQLLRAFTRQLLKPVIFTVKKYHRGNKP